MTRRRIRARRPVLQRHAAGFGALLAYGLMAVGLLASTWSAPSRHLAPAFAGAGIGDPAWCVWSLGWTPARVAGGHHPFLNDFLSYPYLRNMMWATPAVVLALLLWPVTAVWSPLASYNVLITADLAFSAWTAALFCRRLGVGRAGAFVGGALYGFGPFMAVHTYGHADLSAGWILPLIGILLHELLVVRRHSPRLVGAALGMAAVVAFFALQEWLVIATAAAVPALAVAAALHPPAIRPALGAARRAVVPALGVFAVCVAWPLWLQLAGPSRPAGPVQNASAYVTDAEAPVVPAAPQQFAPAAAQQVSNRFTGTTELQSYLGLPAILLVVLSAVVLRRRRLIVVFAVTAAVVTVLSMGAHLHVGGRDTGVPLPWAAVAHVPFLGNALPARLMGATDLCVAVVVAAVLDLALRRVGPSRAAAVGAVGVAVLALVPRLGRPAVDVPAAYRTPVHPQPAGQVVLPVPLDGTWGSFAAVWQSTSGMSFRLPVMVQAVGSLPPSVLAELPRGAYTPGGYLDLVNGRRPDPGTGPEVLSTLKGLRIRTVVLGPAPDRAEMEDYLDCLLGARSPSLAGMPAWRVPVGRDVPPAGC